MKDIENVQLGWGGGGGYWELVSQEAFRRDMERGIWRLYEAGA